MLAALRGLASGRKLRLFAVACCRRVAHVLPDDRVRRALDAAERVADGEIGVAEWADAEARVKAVRGGLDPLADPRRWDAATAAVIAVSHASRPEHEVHLAANAASAAASAVRPAGASPAKTESAAHARLIREVFGDPIRRVKFSPAWRTSTAVALAAQMYASGDFSAMPILGDALQDADCDSGPVLRHCRDANAAHVRGCWVVDLVLGRE
jgi:hypothetical protein